MKKVIASTALIMHTELPVFTGALKGAVLIVAAFIYLIGDDASRVRDVVR